jgi:hypothetical protein
VRRPQSAQSETSKAGSVSPRKPAPAAVRSESPIGLRGQHNTAAIPLAVFGLLNPIIAGAVMFFGQPREQLPEAPAKGSG